MMLDKKLKEIKVKCYDAGYYLNDSSLSDENIALIKQAFADEGYTYKNEAYIGSGRAFKTDHKELMTGQEWLDRFNDELEHLISRGDGETWMGWGCGEVRQAARKASGVDK